MTVVLKPFAHNIRKLLTERSAFKLIVDTRTAKEKTLVARAMNNYVDNSASYGLEVIVGENQVILTNEAKTRNGSGACFERTISYQTFINDWYQRYQDDEYDLNGMGLLKYSSSIGSAGLFERLDATLRQTTLPIFFIILSTLELSVGTIFNLFTTPDVPINEFTSAVLTLAIGIPLCRVFVISLGQWNYSHSIREKNLKKNEMSYMSEEEYQSTKTPWSFIIRSASILTCAVLINVFLRKIAYYLSLFSVSFCVKLGHTLLVILAVILIIFTVYYVTKRAVKFVSWLWYDGLSE